MPDNSDPTPMNTSPAHQQFSELLPFYANGTLQDAER